MLTSPDSVFWFPDFQDVRSTIHPPATRPDPKDRIEHFGKL
jgi:hypothetical protein